MNIQKIKYKNVYGDKLKSSPKNTGAFTLIEMLVVVSILFLLLALIVSAVNRGIDRARVTSCQNNLHQLSKGASIYAVDHNGSLPYGCMNTTALNYSMHANGAMALYPEYISDHRVYFCPGDKRPKLSRTEFEKDYNSWGIRSSYGSRLMQRRRAVGDPALEGNLPVQIFPVFPSFDQYIPRYTAANSILPRHEAPMRARVFMINPMTVVLTERNVNGLGNAVGNPLRGIPDHPNSRFHSNGINAVRMDGSVFFTPWEKLQRKNGTWIVGEAAFTTLERL